jgi:hypothetical protein
MVDEDFNPDDIINVTKGIGYSSSCFFGGRSEIVSRTSQKKSLSFDFESWMAREKNREEKFMKKVRKG